MLSTGFVGFFPNAGNKVSDGSLCDVIHFDDAEEEVEESIERVWGLAGHEQRYIVLTTVTGRVIDRRLLSKTFSEDPDKRYSTLSELGSALMRLAGKMVESQTYSIGEFDTLSEMAEEFSSIVTELVETDDNSGQQDAVTVEPISRAKLEEILDDDSPSPKPC